MNKQQKELVIKELQTHFKSSNGAFLVSYKGMTVSQLHALRTKLRLQGGKLQVAKARLMKRAVADVAGVCDMSMYFQDQVGLVFVSGEVPTIAKLLCDYAKENEVLSVVAGCVDAHVFDKNGVEKFAKLPPVEVLRAQVCGAIKAPTASLVQVLHVSVARIVWILNEVQQKNVKNI